MKKESSGWQRTRMIQTIALGGFGQNILPGSLIHDHGPWLTETSAGKVKPNCYLINYATHPRFVLGFKEGAWAFITWTLRFGTAARDLPGPKTHPCWSAFLTFVFYEFILAFFSPFGSYLCWTHCSTMCRLIQFSFVCLGLYLGKSLQCPLRESRKHGMKERRGWGLDF